jgi:hypothetical protein
MICELVERTAYIGTPEAASLLGVDVITLRMWQERFGFPTDSPGTPGERRRLSRHEVLTLRNAMRTERSVPGAIEQARASAARPATRQ